MNSVLNGDVPILYELLVYEEWIQDPETVKYRNCTSPSISSIPNYPKKLIDYLRNTEWPSKELTSTLESLLPWQIALSPDGQMVAILQEGLLEVRSQNDDFTSTVGKAIVPKDVFPQLRVLRWHPDNTEIVISSSSGVVTIFDTFCSHLYTLPQPLQNENKVSQNVFVAGIEFIELGNREKRREHVVVVYSNGMLISFALSERGIIQESHVSKLDVSQISCAIYNKHFNILLISSQPQHTSKYFQDTCFSAGLSAWRMISDEPLCKRMFPSDDELKMFHAGGKLWKMFYFSNLQGVAVKLSISQNNQFLASLHSCNTIIIWLLPSLRMYRKWSINHDDDDCLQKGLRVDKAPVDIGWRHDEKLIISRKDGSISVHHIETFEVCYGSGSELLSGHPRISSTESFPGFITLECDTTLLSPFSEDSLYDDERSILEVSSEMIQNTIYYMTDIDSFQPKKKCNKVIKKIYRLIGVKSTTPEELFWRKLDNNEYSGALELAEEFGLNSDEVYKKLWKMSVVSAYSINENLSKIKNISWVLNECIQRVPESFSGAEDLYNFAFDLTSFNNTFDGLTLDSVTNDCLDPLFNPHRLDALQKEKLMTRIILLNYADKLRAYKEILGGDPDKDGTYDMTQYDRFRKLPIVESTVYFARQCDINAVNVIFKYYSSSVSPFWLSILENIPEIYSPSNYSSILPRCEGGFPVLWQLSCDTKRDWVETKKFEPFNNPLSEVITMNGLEQVVPLNATILSLWYRKRALDIELRSKLLLNSLTLLQLGMERNITNLDDLYSNFVTLKCMVYELELDIDTSAFLNMTDLQKCIKLMEKIPADDFTEKMLKLFIPFLNRHNIAGERRFQLYKDFLTYTSHQNLKSALLFIRYLLEDDPKLMGGPQEMITLLIECIYNHSSLDLVDETLDVIDSSMAWIASLSDASGRRNLLNLLNELREESSAARILAQYKIPMPIQSIHCLKKDECEPRRIIEQIIRSTIKKYHTTRSASIFNDCLNDVLALQEICFKNIHLNDCYEIYASSLLNSHCLQLIELSSEVLCSKKETEKSCFLSFDVTIDLVLSAVQRYFDVSENVDDDSMTLAKACLFLIKDDHPAVSRELDLIQALRYLNEVGITLIPIQVRQSYDRMKLLNLCFDKNNQLYRKPQFIYKLGAKLRICGDDIVSRHNVITKKLANASFNDGANAVCVEFCKDLVTNNYSEGWEIVLELLKKDVVEDLRIQKWFWCFCTIHVPSRDLNDLMKLRVSRDLPSVGRAFESIPLSLANTPDSEDLDDYHLASSDSSYKLDEASDAEPIPCFCSPHFYQKYNDYQVGHWCEYRVTKSSDMEHPILYVLHVSSGESLLSFIEAQRICISHSTIESKLIELCGKYMNKDTLVALGFLLSVNNPLSCEDFFDKLPQVLFVQELAIYYYCHCSLREMSQRGLKSPYQAICEASILTDSEYKCLIEKYTRKWESLMQTKSMKEENCGVNYERFLEDDSYKTDTIFGLAMTPEKLGIAFELAKKNNIPALEIALTHIEALFFEDKVDSLEKSKSENSDLGLILKSANDSVLQRFQSHYENIDGKDYKTLSNFFKIVLCLNGEYLVNGLTPKENIKLMKRIESTLSGLDYKELVSKSKSLITLLKPFLTQFEMVGNCVKFTKSLPRSLKNDFSTNMLYYEFALHQFNSLCRADSTLKQCASNFESLFPCLSKLNRTELLEFVKHSICDSDIVRRLDYVVRRQLLNSLLLWCSEANNMSSDLQPVIQYIQEQLENLNTIWNDEEEEYFSNPTFKRYLCDIELHGMSELQQPSNLTAILANSMCDPDLTGQEQMVLKRIIHSLDPQSNLMEPISQGSSTPEDPQSETEIKDIADVAPMKNELKSMICFCNKVITQYPEYVLLGGLEDVSLAHLGITSSMLGYLFLPEANLMEEGSGDTCSTSEASFSKYDVATAIINANPPPDIFQIISENTMKAFEDESSDKVFLVWLCITCKSLNLEDCGESFLTSNLEVDQLVNYLRCYPKTHKQIIPILVSKDKFAHVVSSILQDGDTATSQSVIEALHGNGMLVEAGTLKMYSRKVPSYLKTFGSSYH